VTKLAKPTHSTDIAHLTPHALLARVHAVGLEDAGDLAALATPAQLAEVFDHDLWQRAAGADLEERFDAARFGLWLEVLLEMGAAHAARRLLEIDSLDEDVLALGLSKLLAVFETQALALAARSEDDEGAALDKLLEGTATLEIDGWLLVGRGAHTDAAFALLAELDAHHREDLERVLTRIANLTDAEADDHGGAFALLSDATQLEHFVSPADAKAFLALCTRGAVGHDAISRAYLGPPATRTRNAELAFLANVLVAHERLAALDAARKALALCGRGMKGLPAQAGDVEMSLLTAFAAGWRSE
jgi:SHS2 domain-containing protein